MDIQAAMTAAEIAALPDAKVTPVGAAPAAEPVAAQ
jgi:hypothetical protein